ncbi:hypothetical protein [Oceanobacillus kapialis]|uniref:hypothetical protein n=1 Tax=Oceanobacillus kapialis TaxID=481353 RepID=UPI00384FA090
MDILSVAILFIAPFCLIFTYVILKFSWSKEAKGKQGKEIVKKAFLYSAPIFPVGWLCLDMFHRYIQELSLEIYRDFMLLLLLVMMTVYGAGIHLFKNNQQRGLS